MTLSCGHSHHILSVHHLRVCGAGFRVQTRGLIRGIYLAGAGIVIGGLHEEGSGYCEWLAVLEGLGVDEEFSL